MESQLKRSTGADDSSTILPGHGGILDRFDAMVVAAPLIYLYLRVVVGVL
jgi:phosphatidate cytidylyltransferase